MTIGIDKRGFMWDEEDKVISRKKELEEDSSVFNEEEKERMWVFYTNNTFGGKILTFSAAMTRNSVPMMEESGDFDATIDCWVEMFVKGFEACFMIGFYLNDWWTLNSDNHEEVMRRAYIRKYVAE